MLTFLNHLINGISLGSVYAIIALGYTMVYGIAKMLNFAHGDIIMVGAYICFFAVSTFGLPPIVGVLLAMVVVLMLGYVTLTDVSGSVSSIKRQISDLDEQHVALLTEYEKTFDLATIKAAAEAAGMSKPTSGQIQYIDLSGSDSVTLYKAEGSAGGLLDKAKDGWAYVLEYFR